MTELPKKWVEFKKLVDEVEQTLKYSIAKARGLPDEFADNVQRVQFSAGYYGGNIDADAKRAIETAKKIAKGLEIDRGKSRRDQQLQTIAMRLESIRAVLPSLAAASSIEIGIVARELGA
jgi:hypothetical protein